MTTISNQENFYAVLGLGKTGESVIEHLTKKGHRVVGIDSRLSPPNITKLRRKFNNVEYILGNAEPSLLNDCSLIVTSPGFEYEPIKEKYKNKIISDIELFSFEAKAPIIAITGTNGKSTVTSLVGSILKKVGLNVGLGGNLGVPALELLKEANPEYFVLELSSFQLENTYSLRPFVGVVTNISKDHLDRHSSFSSYKKIKESLLKLSKNIVVCNDEEWTSKYRFSDNATTFSMHKPKNNGFGIVDNERGRFFAWGERILLGIEDIKLMGRHNWLNVLAVLAIVSNCIKLDRRVFSEIKTFKGLPHRSEFVVNKNGITFVNDSKATNVGSATATINSYFSKRKGVLIAGGLSKGGDMREFAETISNFCHSVVLIGSCAKELESILSNRVLCKVVKNLKKAVQEASLLAKNGDTVLLAPACSSLDMFKSFEHRGDVFKKAVSEWSCQ